MMKEEKKLQRPSVEKLNEYDELYKKLSDQQLTDKQREELMGQLNDIIGEYDLSNYTFNDPTTGKIGVKNPAGVVMIPAEYDEFSFVGDHNVFKVSHMAAKKDGKWGVVMADGSNKVVCDFRFDYLQWYPYAAHYIAKWDGVEDKFGFVNKECFLVKGVIRADRRRYKNLPWRCPPATEPVADREDLKFFYRKLLDIYGDKAPDVYAVYLDEYGLDSSEGLLESQLDDMFNKLYFIQKLDSILE